MLLPEKGLFPAFSTPELEFLGHIVSLDREEGG